jgi:hypothetical protein
MVNYHHEDCYLGKEKPGFPTRDCRQCELLDNITACKETVAKSTRTTRSSLPAGQKKSVMKAT